MIAAVTGLTAVQTMGQSRSRVLKTCVWESRGAALGAKTLMFGTSHSMVAWERLSHTESCETTTDSSGGRPCSGTAIVNTAFLSHD